MDFGYETLEPKIMMVRRLVRTMAHNIHGRRPPGRHFTGLEVLSFCISMASGALIKLLVAVYLTSQVRVYFKFQIP